MHIPTLGSFCRLSHLLYFCLITLVLPAFAADPNAAPTLPQSAPPVTVAPSSVRLPPGRERALATLKQEDLRKSETQLSEEGIDQYLFPGYMDGGSMNPQADFEMVLSNWRMNKVMQEIKALPEASREAECRRFFTESFRFHTNACRAAIMIVQDPALPASHRDLLSTKLGMSAALVVTAELGRLDLLGEQFNILDQWSKDIEPLASVLRPITSFRRAEGSAPLATNSSVRTRLYPTLRPDLIAPDTKLQVNVIRLGVLRSGNAEMLRQVDSELVSIEMKTKKLHIFPWDDETTGLGIIVENPLNLRGSPAIASKGVLTYTVYDWSESYNDNIILRDNPNAPVERRAAKRAFVEKLCSIAFNKVVTR